MLFISKAVLTQRDTKNIFVGLQLTIRIDPSKSVPYKGLARVQVIDKKKKKLFGPRPIKISD